MAWLARCPPYTVVEHLSHVIWWKLYSSSYVLSHSLWGLHCNYLANQECDLVSIRQLSVTSEPLCKCPPSLIV